MVGSYINYPKGVIPVEMIVAPPPKEEWTGKEITTKE